MSNLKQLTLGSLQYSQDYDEKTMPIRLGAAGSTPFFWPSVMQPYVKSSQIVICPSASDKVVGYTYSLQVGGFGPGRSLADFQIVAQTPMFTDAVGTARTVPLNRALAFNVETTNSYGRIVNDAFNNWDNHREGFPDADRHMEGANYAFVDGHVKWLKAVTRPTGTIRDMASATPADLIMPPSLDLDYTGDGTVGTATAYS